MQIGPYTVDPADRRAGGQAFVYFSVDVRTGGRIALKVPRPSTWSRDRLAKEIRVQKKLDHPNVLPILDHGSDFSWYSTSRADASLDEVGPFPRERWAYLRAGMMSVSSAVGYAHRLRYLHRDIAPGNILVFPGGWAVADWGFVHEPLPVGAARMTQPLERFGQPDFMAPEMVSDPRSAGPPADIYSLGRVAGWATGLRREDPFPDNDPAAAWWRRLIDGTTAYEPSARWAMQDVETHLPFDTARGYRAAHAEARCGPAPGGR